MENVGVQSFQKLKMSEFWSFQKSNKQMNITYLGNSPEFWCTASIHLVLTTLEYRQRWSRVFPSFPIFPHVSFTIAQVPRSPVFPTISCSLPMAIPQYHALPSFPVSSSLPSIVFRSPALHQLRSPHCPYRLRSRFLIPLSSEYIYSLYQVVLSNKVNDQSSLLYHCFTSKSLGVSWTQEP